MGCIVHPALDERFCEERVQEVEEKLEGEERLEFQYIFVRNSDDCQQMAQNIDIEEKESFLAACGREGSSSFTSGDEEYIVISLDKPFLQEN
ncbi:MAG: hypothetical protein SVU32_01125, partial [Candidatus Nanohaloarchaea archaeon]|nr:hypothetical protein [Candidatus Nanohaloarchaea archaeon]